jgi:hypothetical protein
MNFRSIAHLSDPIMRNCYRPPNDIDLAVEGLRSGLLPATLVGLIANGPVPDVDHFVEEKTYSFSAAKLRVGLQSCSEAASADDINTGGCMREARKKMYGLWGMSAAYLGLSILTVAPKVRNAVRKGGTGPS